MHLACAQIEDERNQDIMKHALDFVATIWCGPSKEPTEDNPVVEQSVRSGKTETRVKKVLNVKYEDQVEALRKASIALRGELPALMEKMKSEVAEVKNG